MQERSWSRKYARKDKIYDHFTLTPEPLHDLALRPL